jgi:hypothetical protein
MTSVAWGLIEAGDSVNNTIYIRNSGDIDVSLSLATENWNPMTAADYLTLSWSYDGSVLSSGEVIEVTLRLSLSSSVSGIDSFSFDIVVMGSAS